KVMDSDESASEDTSSRRQYSKPPSVAPQGRLVTSSCGEGFVKPLIQIDVISDFM
ncbi:hypothetical protein BgiMline_032130, partial [Biomphalaria glabrata]